MSDTPLSVVEALSAVMHDVQSIGKTGRNTAQNYSFRGVDAVVNAVGPILRRHGVLVVPTGAVCQSEQYTTAKGTPMRNVTITVAYRFYGPAGDHIDATVCGEAADSGDKAVPKAHSVAYRTLLLQALCIPTDDPEPDAQTHERAAGPKVISDAQRRRLFAIAGENGVEIDQLHALVLSIAGTESTKDIPADTYDALVAAVEAEAVPFA